MQTFPLFLTLRDRQTLVVGGNDAAARKAELLLAASARVSLIAETVNGDIAQLISDGRIAWAGHGFDEADLDGIMLVIVASDDEALKHAAEEASEYTQNLEGVEYTGYSDSYHLFDARIDDRSEVFSLVRKTDIAKDDYIKRFLDTGLEQRS